MDSTTSLYSFWNHSPDHLLSDGNECAQKRLASKDVNWEEPTTLAPTCFTKLWSHRNSECISVLCWDSDLNLARVSCCVVHLLNFRFEFGATVSWRVVPRQAEDVASPAGYTRCCCCWWEAVPVQARATPNDIKYHRQRLQAYSG